MMKADLWIILNKARQIVGSTGLSKLQEALALQKPNTAIYAE